MLRHPALGVVLALALLLPGCAGPAAVQAPDVLATFYPLGYFATRIAGPDLSVATLVPAGAEPHDWEPSPRDVLRAEGARVFVYNGAGFEPWAPRLAGQVEARGGVAVDASAGADLRPPADPGDHGDHGEEGGDHAGEAGEGALDPHVWLDPVRAQRVADNIAEALARADPAHAGAHRGRAAALQGELQALDERFRDGLARCANRHIIATHAAFGYVAARYNFTQHSISGVAPEAEPSPDRLRAVVDLARALNVTHIYFESLVSPRVAEVIAREVGAETLVLNPVEGLTMEEQAAGEDYFTLMRRNLEHLRAGMGCP